MRRVFTAVLLSAIFVSGCATVQGTVETNNFAAFTASLTELKSGVREVSNQLPSIAEDRFRLSLLEEVADENFEGSGCGGSNLDTAQMRIDDTRLNFECLPHFLVVEHFQASALEVMDGLISYAAMLEGLADQTLTNSDALHAQADAVNSGVAAALKLAVPNQANQITSGLPTITGVAMQQMEIALKNQQISALNTAVQSNQEGVQRTVEHLKSAIVHLAQGYRTEQTEQWDRIQPGLFADATREKAVQQVMQYTRNRFATYAAIRELHRAVDNIPAAHAALRIDPGPGNSIAEIERLVAVGKELKQAYGTAAADDRKDALQAQADEADQMAARMQALAGAAQLDASKATVAWTQASIRARESGSQSDIDSAAALEVKMQTLIAEADNKAAEAKALRQAANSVQASVDAIAATLDR
jgi:hypothetical protein